MHYCFKLMVSDRKVKLAAISAMNVVVGKPDLVQNQCLYRRHILESVWWNFIINIKITSCYPLTVILLISHEQHNAVSIIAKQICVMPTSKDALLFKIDGITYDEWFPGKNGSNKHNKFSCRKPDLV